MLSMRSPRLASVLRFGSSTTMWTSPAPTPRARGGPGLPQAGGCWPPGAPPPPTPLQRRCGTAAAGNEGRGEACGCACEVRAAVDAGTAGPAVAQKPWVLPLLGTVETSSAAVICATPSMPEHGTGMSAPHDAKGCGGCCGCCCNCCCGCCCGALAEREATPCGGPASAGSRAGSLTLGDRIGGAPLACASGARAVASPGAAMTGKPGQ
mmetsp:Transcript_108599/g.242439  ORF Transcript_108599/g.242439 Transcript_108599/m.242439 type:complete len:209 (-) Transcript_108599:976-1602(-)